jgi:hypothetical protein
LSAQQDVDDAEVAAAGWGGDQYQVYYDDETGEIVLSAHWVWDTPGDASEFYGEMLDYLDARFRGAKLSRGDRDCWSINLQTTCLFNNDIETLWIIAPDEDILNRVLGVYAGFP